MYCNQCGAEVKEGIRFCNKCGAKLNEVSQSAVNQQMYSQQTAAKWESTSITVDLIEEQETMNTYETFGWELVSSQSMGATVKLVFRRNKNMPNYSRIVELEEEYDFSNPPDPPAQPGFIAPGIGLFLLVLGFNTNKVFLIWSIPFLLVFIVKWLNYKNKNEEYLKRKEDADTRRLKCLDDMRALGIERNDRLL